MSELKPCPCCGSEHVETCAEFWGGAAPAGSEFTDEVMCDDCGMVAPSIEAWNRRADYQRGYEDGLRANTSAAMAAARQAFERTCELTFKRGAMYDVAHYSCCGYEYPEPINETAVAENYCPNCGARVVEP